MKGMKKFTVTSSIAASILILMTATASTVTALPPFTPPPDLFVCPPVCPSIPPQIYVVSHIEPGPMLSGSGTFSETGSATGTIDLSWDFVTDIGPFGLTCSIFAATSSNPSTTVSLIGTLTASTAAAELYSGNGLEIFCQSLTITEGGTLMTGTIDFPAGGCGGLCNDLAAAGLNFPGTSTVIVGVG